MNCSMHIRLTLRRLMERDQSRGEKTGKLQSHREEILPSVRYTIRARNDTSCRLVML